MTKEITPNKTHFADISRTYYRVWFRYHPEAAVDVGVAGYAGLLTPYSEDERGALVCLNDELMVSLDELARYGLSVDEQLDMDILYNAARLENEYLLDVEPRRLDPGKFLPINAIHQLLIRQVEDFPASLLARLRAIPVHMEGARGHLTRSAHAVPPLWLNAAVIAARAGIAFLRDLPAHPKVREGMTPPAELAQSIDDAANALAHYAGFLETEIAPRAEGELGCGSAYFMHLLRRRHYLDISIGELRALGQRLFGETQQELREVCRELSGSEDIAALTRRIQADHPPMSELLGDYRQQMQAAWDFLGRRDLVTVPQQTRLDITETPVFLRHVIPFAAYCEPSPNDPGQQGYYYVTPPEDNEQLAEHNRPGLMHTCVHEAWPGHHLQFVTANLNSVARSLPRLLNPSATLYEGWALYSEQLMLEHGFLTRPESRFILLRDRLWRALRILIDVDLHTGSLDLDTAADMMVRHLGFPRSQALAEITWYSQSPTVPMSYAVGWSIINAVRDRLRRDRADFNLRQFHDLLLSQGSIALPRVVRRVFSESVWSGVRRELFSGVSGEAA